MQTQVFFLLFIKKLLGRPVHRSGPFGRTEQTEPLGLGGSGWFVGQLLLLSGFHAPWYLVARIQQTPEDSRPFPRCITPQYQGISFLSFHCELSLIWRREYTFVPKIKMRVGEREKGNIKDSIAIYMCVNIEGIYPGLPPYRTRATPSMSLKLHVYTYNPPPEKEIKKKVRPYIYTI